MRAILGVCSSDKVRVGRGRRVRVEAYYLSATRESGIATADLDELAGVQVSLEAVEQASEGYGMGREVWLVWLVDGSGQHGRLWCGRYFGGREAIESWTMLVGDIRVAGDGCLLDGEVSRCGRLAYDRLEVLERARKCLTELQKTA
ncbi:hypothetical protein ARMGADRAFT_217119 [Armillaria gallica]|uniref:Uncharacterized protein n=1 Tax=Armillaria gallica TaxID=47427 RepID=A0A2H3C7R0_ARMGA|nr:hypothetical protein ARMGADRAFT_219740 [Armillaria gallica]PBK79089.1 hypothetical protein ARMGADRAFT_217119 [Armillaria gallica]